VADIHWDTDVFVAGGGPAGLAAAIAARQKGLRVTLADMAKPPIDKACGEGLMPDGIACLRQLGVTLGAAHGVPFRGIRFVDGETRAEAAFPGRVGVGVRRTTLHRLLSDRAEEAGVELLWGSRITGLGSDGVTVGGKNLRSRWIIGADGQNSLMRRWAGLEAASGTSRRFGFRRHFRVEQDPDLVEVHWHDRGQLYLTPVATGQVCIAVVSRDPQLRLDEALALFPHLRGFLAAPCRSTEIGNVSVSRRLRSVYGGSVALVGEAAGSLDAITGEGLAVGFKQALGLADCLASGSLLPYGAQHRKIMTLPSRMERLMLVMDRHPRFCRRAVRALAAEPRLFSGLLAFHLGAAGPRAREVFSGGWHLLTA